MFVKVQLVALALLTRQGFCLSATSLDSAGRLRKYELSNPEVWGDGAKNESIALHFSLTSNSDSSNDKGWQHRLLSLLDALHYCFDEVLITIDPPHGGKTYGPSYLPGPYVDGTSEFLSSPHGQDLLLNARQALKAAASKLKGHCPKHQVHKAGGVIGSVDVIDYTSLRTRTLLADAFNLSAETTVSNESPWKLLPASSPDFQEALALLSKGSPWKLLPTSSPYFQEFLPARMWKNSLMYMYAVDAVKSRFVLHADADLDLMSIRLGMGSRPSFPESASKTLAKYSQVVSVGVPSCYRDRGILNQHVDFLTDETPQGSLAEAAVQGWDCANGGCKVVDGTYIVAEITTRDAESPLVPYMSTKLFLTDVSRFKSLWPLPYWEDQTEVILMHALGRHRKEHVYLTSQLADLCFE